MVSLEKTLLATKGILAMLPHDRRCSCGHQKDYHVNGKSKCVFGICRCEKYGTSDAHT